MTELLLIIFAAGLIYYVATKVATPGLIFKMQKEVVDPQKTKETPVVTEKGDGDDLVSEGQALFNKGDLDQAEKKFLAAIKKDPALCQAYTFLGMIYLRQKMYKGAIASLEKGCKLDPLNDTAFNNLGLAYYSEKNYEKSIENFEKSIHLNDKIAHRYLNLALALQEMKNYDKAAIALESAVKIHPSTENLTLLTKNYLQMGDKKLARKSVERLLEVDPKNTWAKRQQVTLTD